MLQLQITQALTTQIPIRDEAQNAFRNREVARANQIRAAWLAAAAAARSAGGHASGGMIRGAGGPTDDQIPAWLSNGEYVVRAAAVSRYGKGFLDSLNTMSLAGGGSVSNDHRNMSKSVTVNNYGEAAHISSSSEMLHWHARKAI